MSEKQITILEQQMAFETIQALLDELLASVPAKNQEKRGTIHAVYENVKTLANATDYYWGAMEEAVAQRNQALEEINTFIEKLKTGRYYNDPLAQEIAMKMSESLTEEYNDAFWSSFPYDLADAMGGDWHFWEADLLYDVLISASDEVADGRNLPENAILDFRSKVLSALRELAEKEGQGE